MQGKFLKSLRKTLQNCIHELDYIHSLFVQNPNADFTRNRKIMLGFFKAFTASFSLEWINPVTSMMKSNPCAQ